MTGRVMPTRRERLQEATREEIKGVARRQMAEKGAASLSLRAIAAEMGLTAPALYRYYADRDALITALIVDAFEALGEALSTARQEVPTSDPARQFVVVMTAYRAWAVAHRADFTLIYGTPIPGYQAPAAITAPAARRSLTPLVELLLAAWWAGAVRPTLAEDDLPLAIRAQLSAMLSSDLDPPVPTAVLYSGVVAWMHLQGLIMLELFGHVTPVVGDAEVFYALEVRRVVNGMGFVTDD